MHARNHVKIDSAHVRSLSVRAWPQNFCLRCTFPLHSIPLHSATADVSLAGTAKDDMDTDLKAADQVAFLPTPAGVGSTI